MRRRDVLGAVLAMPAILRAPQARAATPVDVELVLAVDVSRSVDPEEQEMQFSGYEAAFRDPRLIEGIMGGPVGAIAVTMFTWSDWHIQNTVVPWMLLDGAAAANRFADAIGNAPRRTWLYTSISGAMDYAARQFGQGFEGTRKVVDISGDGVNNSGRAVADARAEALAQGIVLNGLAVLDRTPQPLSLASAMPPLDTYYQQQVIGGPGAFLVVAEGFPAFEAAVRRKIIREIAAVPQPGPAMERFA
ncbi:MAG: vWFA-like protein with metal ion dependent adhesion motif (MIDAS) [uncultured Craurococcus sp.]|uniref:VWFA-like protein with metal ion dependent adhesion motif (MIDAS) n=1 Tax=uncultured Craurococcus sp. TaxID=1135998 RepID=A0A6J4JBT0_9PROT|nr:MAG: vWFA-like protein with metal ion dependent adhesion motif (MIDAS) [uncultured Craurococcus sp.]